MIYGRTNKNQIWEMKRLSSEPAIIYNENSKVVPIPGLMESLKEQSFTGLFFYVYSYFKKERFVFVTTDSIDFLALNNPENMVLSGISCYVKGALWDLEQHRFVSFNRPEGTFLNFMLYDAGIPNVVYDIEEKCYTIFALDGNDYRFYDNRPNYQPAIISHLWKNKKIGRPVNNRLIFITPKGKDQESMLILHEEIELEALYKDVSFVESIPVNLESMSDISFFKSVHGLDAVGHSIKNAEPCNVRHLVFDDGVIVQQPYDDYCILFVDNGHFVFNEQFDCYDYEKVFPADNSPCTENIIKVYYRRNDFENGIATFNVTTGKIS